MTDSIAGARVLVTGGTGFIGSNLVRRLVSDGADVHVISKAVSMMYPYRLTDLRDQIHLHEGSLTDRSDVEFIVAEAAPEVVFHLGAYTHVGKSWRHLDQCIQTNVQGTANLLQALDQVSYRRFVNIGTSEIYGAIDMPCDESSCVRPVSPYAASKHAAEELCRVGWQSWGWPIVMLRPFNAYGPAQSSDRVIPEVIIRAIRRDELKMTKGEQTREFNHVDDLADGMIRAALVPGIEGELVNLGCGIEVSMGDLAQRILDLMGNPIDAQVGALPDRPVEIWRMSTKSTKARDLLEWEPQVSLGEGLQRVIDWYRDELARPGSPFVPSQ